MIVVWIFAGLALLFLLTGNFFYDFALRRRTRRHKPSKGAAPPHAPAAFRMEREWLKATPQEDVHISSFDRLQLRARLLVQGAPRRFVLLCHGYGAHSASMACFARHFYESGWSLLMPDARGHGESEGRYYGMGWPERRDVLGWIDYLNAHFDHPVIVLMGVSMGGATVMNTVGEALPGNVRCAIEDCGYVSIRRELSYQLKHRFHIPAYPALWAASLVSRVRAGLSLLSDGHTLDQLHRCKIPLLFIHGGADDFVPVSMLDDAYAAAGGPKEKLLIPGAAHAESAVRDPERYWASVNAFLKRYADS